MSAVCEMARECSRRVTRGTAGPVQVTVAATFEWRGEWQYHPAGEVLTYQPEDVNGGALLTWRAWSREERDLVGREAECDEADEIARELGLYVPGPLACRWKLWGSAAYCAEDARLYAEAA